MNEKMNTEDKVLFEKMYLEYQEVLRKIAYKYDVPPDDIEDVVQDTFVAYAYYKYDLLCLRTGRRSCLPGFFTAAAWIITEGCGR